MGCPYFSSVCACACVCVCVWLMLDVKLPLKRCSPEPLISAEEAGDVWTCSSLRASDATCPNVCLIFCVTTITTKLETAAPAWTRSINTYLQQTCMTECTALSLPYDPWMMHKGRYESLKNEWMNEWLHLYSAFIVYCHTPKALYNHVGGHSSTTTSVQHPLDDATAATGHGTSALTNTQLQVERREREIEPIKLMGIIRRPWLTRASGGNLARTPGLYPYSLRWVLWDF